MSLIKSSKLLVSAVTLAISGITSVQAAQDMLDARMMRYPDVSQDTIIFTYASDLWIVPIKGGQAVRLTSDNDLGKRGLEKRAKFSPGGKEVAYSATYNYNKDIYRLSIGGGIPHRITHHPAPDIILDWTADGRDLLFASNRYSERPRFNKLFTVSGDGGLPQQLPLAYGETAALSKDGQQIIYTVKKDFQEESWKRYHGGRAPDLWFLDQKTGQSKKLTNYDGPDSQPMWVGDKVYYLSEEGKSERSNLWVLDLETNQKRQVTFYDDHDVRHPSIGPEHIVFQQGADLLLLSLSDEKISKVDVKLILDQNTLKPTLHSVKDQIRGATASPDGKTAYFHARGEIFSLDIKHQISQNLTETAGAAERYPSVSPDGNSLAYFSDQGGEYQLHIRDLNNNIVRTLTKFKDGYRYQPQWSPDSKQVAFVDNKQILRLINVKNGKMTQVDKGLWRGHYDLQEMKVAWSSDSKWVGFSRHVENFNQAIFLFDVKNKRLKQVTSGNYNDYDPVFDPEGNYLYLLSHRQFFPTFGDIDFTWTYSGSTVIAAIPLSKNTLSPFDVAWEKPEKATNVTIDLDGFEKRLVILPLKKGAYDSLMAKEGGIIYRSLPPRLPDGMETRDLKLYDLTDKSERTILKNASTAQYLASSNQLFIQQGESYGLIDAKPDQSLEKALKTENLRMVIDHRAENAQVLTEALRYIRDFFYDPGLHGVDWKKVGDSYRALLPSVTTDEDMTIILRELAAEVSGGHVWAIASNARRNRKNQSVGLLGADFEIANGAFRISKIYAGGDYAGAPRSPLAAPGLNITEGDYLLAVNGKKLSINDNPWKAFEAQVNKIVKLTIAPSANGKGSRDILVKTISNEQKLRELDWVETNRQKVLKASNGQLGYLYLPDTSLNGQNDLMRQFRAQFHKKGLVVDERFNMGGALGDRLVELLNRPALNYFSNRNAMDYPLPTVAHNGPKVLITNGWSYSGGDGFPLLFKTAKVGPLVGTQTWGGLIGPNLPLPLISGGAISAPPQRVYDLQGQWAEGNEGVRPDITVENDPARLYDGQDKQLDRAIQEVLKIVKAFPKITIPAFPSGLREE